MQSSVPPDNDRGPATVAGLMGWTDRQARGQPVPLGVLPGEGIGPEVVGAALHLLQVAQAVTDVRFDVRIGGPIGLEAWRASGRVLTPEVTDFCRDLFRRRGAVLCGPGGGRFVYELRRTFDLYCKLVPIRPLDVLLDAGAMKPEAVRGTDVLVIRENVGGLYQGTFGTETTERGLRAYQQITYDEHQVARVLRIAIRAAAARRGHLCIVTKPAGVPAISALWQDLARELVGDQPVHLEILEVDTACYRVIADPRRFDVLAAPNMFGDVVADTATILLASRGLSYSANFADDGAAVYQTGHGAAYDLAGTDRANPLGQIQSLAMLLRESCGLGSLADGILAAATDTLAAGWRTPDMAIPGCRVVGTGELSRRIGERLAELLQPVAGVRAAALEG